MTEDRAHEIAEEEWRDMNPMEKCQAIDPEKTRNLFVEYLEAYEKDYNLEPSPWLFEQGEHWREHRAQQLLEQDLPEYEPEEERGGYRG